VPGKDKTGPKGWGPKDGRGGGIGKGPKTPKGTGPKSGGGKGNC
jgi:hypothetical protein